MVVLSIKDGAAVSRIAARLAPCVTNSFIDSLARALGFDSLPASNLARPGWREGLEGASQLTPNRMTPTVTPLAQRPERSIVGARPQRHPEALAYLMQLVADDSRPQHRGYELEKILFDVLQKENLDPLGNIVNPGEQIDLAFVLDGHHYLAECKWESDPVGLPIVAAFATKVNRKAEGTFGVLISMSGFVQNINETAGRGARLNCVGIIHQQLIGVLEGRTAVAALVRAARASASTKAMFFGAA